MRIAMTLLVGLAGAANLFAADGEVKSQARYGVELDLKTYPQETPKAVLASVVKAAEAGKFDYLAAQLADPSFIDDRVKSLFDGNFAEQVKDVHARLDSSALKELHRFLIEGEWKADDADASVRIKDVTDHAVYFRKLDGRWFLEHASKPKS
jgi:hypothetical protein